MRHIAIMSSTSALGLIAIFVVDLINLFYISLLGQPPMVAAVGFAGVVSFFQTSFCIGLMIGISAVFAKTIGAGRADEARRIAASSVAFMAGSTTLLALGCYLFLDQILELLGASGEAKEHARDYLLISLASVPFLGVSMALSALIRSVGDAKRSMNVTLVGAVMTALLDPLLIFGLHLDLVGAAIVSVLARMSMLAVGLHAALRAHHLVGRFQPAWFAPDIKVVMAIAGPAILANLATPFGNAFVTRFMADFGPDAVAGLAAIDRLVPVAFGLVYALSGAIGPILAQNLGAGEFGRVRQGLRDSLLFMAVAVAGAWLLLALGQRGVIWAFSATGQTAELISLFCLLLAGGFLFMGALFVSNATFNNLGHPKLSMLFNWCRATLGTIPLAWIGSHYGATGVLMGPAFGGVVFGTVATVVAFRIVGKLGAGQGK